MPTSSSDLAPAVVSVVIPCHNAGPWIHRAVTSALAQSGVQTEVIVVDDGSTDKSREVLRAFGPRIRVLDNPVRGGNRARNTGLAAATGEWVQFLDADDYLEPDKIVRQLHEAGAGLDQADVLYSPVLEEVWRDDRAVKRVTTPLDTATDLFTQWLSWQLPQTGGPLWRRTSLQALGCWQPDQPCCQEHELYLRSLKAGQRWQFCPSALAIYRIWSEQTVCRRDPVRVIVERTRLIDTMLDWLRVENRLQAAHVATAGRACFEMARTWALHDLDKADTYRRERKALGVFHPTGPAAPGTYRLMLMLIGFKRAEQLAGRLRAPLSS